MQRSTLDASCCSRGTSGHAAALVISFSQGSALMQMTMTMGTATTTTMGMAGVTMVMSTATTTTLAELQLLQQLLPGIY